MIEKKKKISEIGLPVIIYNVPSRTGLNILPETYDKLSDLKNIVGIKEASGNISQVAEVFALCRNKKNFNLYSGNDDQIVPILSLGGHGVISVLANIFPKETQAVCQYFFDGEIKKSRDIQLKFLPLIKNLFCEVNPLPIKFAMNYLGFDVGKCRLPLTELSEQNKNKIIAVLNDLK